MGEERVMLRLEDGAEDMYDDDTISSDSTRLPSPCSAQTSPRSLNRSIATPASNRSSSAPARRRIETAMTSQGAERSSAYPTSPHSNSMTSLRMGAWRRQIKEGLQFNVKRHFEA